MGGKRRVFGAAFKAKLALASIRGDKTTAEMASKFAVHTSQVTAWPKQLFENGGVAFERKPNKANQRRQKVAQQQKIAELEQKIQKKNDVVAELLEEHVQLKKAHGEL